MDKKIAVFPGSFDPITLGHVDIILRSLNYFDKLIIGIGVNSSKNTLFSLEQRKEWIIKTFEGNSKIEAIEYEGLTVEFCKKMNAQTIVRGVRTVADFEYEKAIAQMNFQLAEIETLFLMSKMELSSVSSTIIREIIKGGGEVSKYLPNAVVETVNGQK